MVSGIPRALAASRLRLGLVGLLVVVATLGGGYSLGVLGTPGVADVSNHFGTVSEETTAIHTDLVVRNPNPVGVGLDDVTVTYAVDLNDVRMARGEKEGVAVGAGNSTVSLETAMRNEVIPAWWVSHLRNGEHSDLVVHATVTSGTLNESVEAPEFTRSVDTDISSSFNSTETRELEADREPAVRDPVLYVNETSGWWGEVTEEETTIEMRFRVYNPKEYAIPVQEVQYDVAMNGIGVGSGSTEQSYVVPPHGTETVAASLTLDNDMLDEWWVSHLQRDQVTDLTIDLSMVVDLSNAGGPRTTVPVDTIEHTIETDIFGNKAEYPTGESADGADEAGDDSADGSDGEDSTDDGTPTATGGGPGDGSPSPTSGATPTSTPTPTATPTPTPTPTEDDDVLGAVTGPASVTGVR